MNGRTGIKTDVLMEVINTNTNTLIKRWIKNTDMRKKSFLENILFERIDDAVLSN